MNIQITVPQIIDIERVQTLFITATEGGSNHWYRNLCILTDVDTSPDEPGVVRYHKVATTPGGILGIDDCEGDSHTLDLDKIKAGLQVMAKDYPRHWADFMAENDDAETGDVFLQCCLFGDVVYG